MNTIFINNAFQVPFSDLQFRYSRSGGPGGQNVNKVSTRVELIFDVPRSSLDQKVKETLRTLLSSRLDSTGCLRIVSQDSRSQWKNKQDAVEKFISFSPKSYTASEASDADVSNEEFKECQTCVQKGEERAEKNAQNQLG